jgi:NADH dehydrogenase
MHAMQDQCPATHVVVIGAGFGGVAFCQSFNDAKAHVTLLDRHNYHLFQPLLYQVATADLSPSDIAEPIRTIFDRHPHTQILMDEVTGVDLASRRVMTRRRTLAYDYLVLAVGARTGYFGNLEWEKHTIGLKSISDALRIRNQVLTSFEEAENCTDPDLATSLMTTVIIGGGPTGVELAGAIGELTRRIFRRDFRVIDTYKARVIMIQSNDRLLPFYHPDLSGDARRRLERIGVEVKVSTRVKDITAGKVHLDTGEVLEANNIIWCAGVEANPLGRTLGVPTDRAGRIKVNGDLSLPDHPEVFAIGDMVSLTDVKGREVPGVAPAAMQMGQHVAKIILDELDGKLARDRRPLFEYWDKGSMATIGRAAAVAEFGKVRLTGFIAWLAWLAVHLLLLAGFENKVLVLMEWFFRYVTNRSGARIINRIQSPDQSETK